MRRFFLSPHLHSFSPYFYFLMQVHMHAPYTYSMHNTHAHGHTHTDFLSPAFVHNFIYSCKLFSIFLISFFLSQPHTPIHSLIHSRLSPSLSFSLSLFAPPQKSPLSFVNRERLDWRICEEDVVSLPGGKLWREMKVEKKKKKSRQEEGEEEERRNYATTPSLSLPLSLSGLRWCMAPKATCWPCDGLKHFVGKLLRAPQHTRV